MLKSMPISLTSTSISGFVLGAASLCLTSCAPEYAGIIVNVKSIPADASKLILKPVVSGKTLNFEVFDQNINGGGDTQIGLRIAREDLGRQFGFSIDAYGVKNCSIATGKSGNLQIDEIKKYEVDVVMRAGNDVIDKDLFHVHGSGPNDVWAVGAEGTAAHWDGCTWRVNSLGAGKLVSKIYVSPAAKASDSYSQGTAYAIIVPNNIKRWDGAQWIDLFTAMDGALGWIHGNSNNNIWAAGERSGGGCQLYRFDGESWLAANYCQPISTIFLRGVYSLSDKLAFAVGTENSKEAAAIWNGSQWKSILINPPNTAGSLYTAWGIGGDLWAGGELNTLRRNTGTGGSLIVDASVQGLLGMASSGRGIFSVSGTGPQDIWLVAVDAGVGRVLHFDGGMWSFPAGLDASLIRAVWAQSPSDVWFVGMGGLRVHYDGQRYTKVD